MTWLNNAERRALDDRIEESFAHCISRDDSLGRLEAAAPPRKSAIDYNDPRVRGKIIESFGPQLVPTPITEARRRQPGRNDPWVICCTTFDYHDPWSGPQRAIACKTYFRAGHWVVREHFWNFAKAPQRTLTAIKCGRA